MRRLVSFTHALFVFCFLSLTSVVTSCDSLKSRGVSPGDRAPEVALSDIDGKPLALSQFRGKVVLLNFWATWCGPCILELPALQKLHQRFSSRDFTVLGVAIDDDRDSLTQLRAEYGLTFPIVDDAEGKAKHDYHLTGVPETLLIDRDGKVVLFIDPDGGEPTARAIGPKNWESASFASQIEKLLAPGS